MNKFHNKKLTPDEIKEIRIRYILSLRSLKIPKGMFTPTGKNKRSPCFKQLY